MASRDRAERLTCKHTGEPGDLLLFEVPQSRIQGRRWDPEFYDPKYKPLFRDLKKRKAVPLGYFIPEDGGITYGQVGKRHLSPKGTVRYLQVINIQETGIDFAVKPDRVKEGSHNDPERSRIQVGDLLLSNTGFGGTSQLLGRSVAVVLEYGKTNVSQDIDRICLKGLDPAFVCVFLRGRYGQQQLGRLKHGVKSIKINFEDVREVQIPPPPERICRPVREHYLAVNRWHERAMARKEELASAGGRALRGKALKKVAEEDLEYLRRIEEARRRLRHVIREVERYVAGETESIRPYPA